MLKKIKNTLYILGVVSIAGCTVGPDYQKPEVAGLELTGLDQSSQVNMVDEAEQEKVVSWWQNFNDPVLSQLIAEALESNYSLEEAKARLIQARAALGMQTSFDLPTLDASGSYSRTNYSKETRGTGGTYDIHSSGFDAGWELDIFGGRRRAIESAEADLAAVEAELEDVWVSISAEVAASYIDLRMYQQQLEVANNNLDAQSETLELLNSRMEAGLSNGLAVKQAEYNVETTRSTIPEIISAIEASSNKLAILTGKVPGEISQQVKASGNIPASDSNLIIDIPVDILSSRPDIRAAERALAAQSARIGQATANLYPKFRLNGSIGVEAFRIDNMFDNANDYYSFGPSVAWNIFDGDYIRNSIKVQDALYQQYNSRYQAVVLEAVAEIRNSLVAWQQQKVKYQALVNAEQAAESALDLAQDQYNNGLTDFNNVLDSQRALLSLQSQKVTCQGDIASSLVRLYKSLGGGWPAQ